MNADGASPQERQLVTAVQDALLPAGVVALPAVDIAARYLLGETGRSAGGDWFDAVPLPGDRVALVVGDVVGQGVAAASTMGQLRAVVLSALLTHEHPTPTLGAAAAFAEVVPEARGATVAIAVLDPGSSSLCYSTAGHPPPLIVRADGTGSFLPATGGGPLGTGARAPVAAAPFGPGDLVLLYTDGLVVRPGADPADGRAELRTVATQACREASDPQGTACAAELVCERALDRIALRTGVWDDAAVLAAQRCAPTGDLVLDLPALPDTVRVVRLELGVWLARLRLSAIDQLALQQAVGELVSNAVEHAYPAGVQALRTSVRLRATHAADGCVEIDVVDDGRWVSSPGPHRGLALAAGFVDHLETVPRGRGTHLRLRHRALRTARLLSWERDRPLGVGRAPAETLTVRPGPGRLEVAGAVDALGVDRLAAEVRRATAGPVAPVVVDLSGVSLLCSGAVQVLSDALPGAGPVRAPIVLRAPADSVAGLVLDLARVPYEGVGPAA